MKKHCYCHMLPGKRGAMVDPERADYVRDGIPICSTQCCERYDLEHPPDGQLMLDLCERRAA